METIIIIGPYRGAHVINKMWDAQTQKAGKLAFKELPPHRYFLGSKTIKGCIITCIKNVYSIRYIKKKDYQGYS